jgi:hypothetical protein
MPSSRLRTLKKVYITEKTDEINRIMEPIHDVVVEEVRLNAWIRLLLEKSKYTYMEVTRSTKLAAISVKIDE